MANGRICRATKRVCKICGDEKPETDFYPMKEWFDSYCKPCRCAYQRERYVKTKPARQAYEINRANAPHRVKARKAYSQTERGEDAMKRARAKYTVSYPAVRRAHTALRIAVRDGKIVKAPCAVCGTTESVDGHHEDYSKPLDVIWLCRAHHAALHKERRQERA